MHEEESALVGNFSATCLLEVDAAPGSSFADGARRLQHQLWSDLQHGLVSGVRVLREINRVQRTGARAAMPVVFASVLGAAGQSQTAPRGVFRGLAGVGDDLQSVHCSIRTPQVWLDHQIVEDAGELVPMDAVEGCSGRLMGGVPGLSGAAGTAPAGASAGGDRDAVAHPMQGSPDPRSPAGPCARPCCTTRPRRVSEDPHRVAVISPRRTLHTRGRRSPAVAAWLHERGAPDGWSPSPGEGWGRWWCCRRLKEAALRDRSIRSAGARCGLLAHAEGLRDQSHSSHHRMADGAPLPAFDHADEMPSHARLRRRPGRAIWPTSSTRPVRRAGPRG